MTAFDDYFARMMPDVDAWVAEHAAEPVAGRPVVVPMEPLTVRKLGSVVVVPNELLMDYGVIPDTRPKPPPPTWRTRLRWKREQWRERTARRAFKIIAGYWPDSGDDD